MNYRVYTHFGKANHFLKTKIKKNGWVAHHGIQRSGTNYLLHILTELNVDVINKFPPERNHPANKHFRWYCNKSDIPPFLAKQYQNNVSVKNLTELNQKAGYPPDTLHIITKKDLQENIVSLCNWGMRVGWFNSRGDALSSVEHLKRDYESYYNFWQNMSKNNRDKVLIVNHDDILDYKNIYSKLDYMKIDYKKRELHVREIPQSPKNRKKYFSIEDLSGQI